MHFKVHKFGFLLKNQALSFSFGSVRICTMLTRFNNMRKGLYFKGLCNFLAVVVYALSDFQGSKYYKLNGKRIRKRKDGNDPNVTYLKQRNLNN